MCVYIQQDVIIYISGAMMMVKHEQLRIYGMSASAMNATILHPCAHLDTYAGISIPQQHRQMFSGHDIKKMFPPQRPEYNIEWMGSSTTSAWAAAAVISRALSACAHKPFLPLSSGWVAVSSGLECTIYQGGIDPRTIHPTRWVAYVRANGHLYRSWMPVSETRTKSLSQE